MDYNIYLQKHKMSKHLSNFFNNEILNISELQTYFPIMEDYNNYINNSDDHKNYILNSRYILNNLYSDNLLDTRPFLNKKFSSNIYDSLTNSYFKTNSFFKTTSILNPLSFIKNEYSENIKIDLPFSKKYILKRSKKILNKNNSAYIDAFCTYLLSKLVEDDMCPNFPLYYGNYIGISKTHYCDLTEEYELYKDQKWFKKNIENKKFEVILVNESNNEIIQKKEDSYHNFNLQTEELNIDNYNFEKLESLEDDSKQEDSIENESSEEESLEEDLSKDNKLEEFNYLNIESTNQSKITKLSSIFDNCKNEKENFDLSLINLNSLDNSIIENNDNLDKDFIFDLPEETKIENKHDENQDSIESEDESLSSSEESLDLNNLGIDNALSSEYNFLDGLNILGREDLLDDQLNIIDKLSDISSTNIDVKSQSCYNEILAYIKIKDLPVDTIVTEYLDGTLEKLLQIDKKIINNINSTMLINKYLNDDFRLIEKIWLSYLWQISFALSMAQKYYKFTHNDLHSNNVMFKKTDIEYLYYMVNNQYYKIPTNGNILKIIDFGRGIFKLNKRIYFSDVFEHNSEAGEQYTYPFEKNCKTKGVYPNMSFDLSRLSTSIIEDLFADPPPNLDNGKKMSNEDQYETISPLFNLLYSWIVDKNGDLVNKFQDFNLYKVIARKVNSAVPINQLVKKCFDIFKIDHLPKNIHFYKL